MKILEAWRRKWRARRERKERPAETIEGVRVIRYVTGSGDSWRTLGGPGIRPPDVRS